jgi:hypothetical protein
MRYRMTFVAGLAVGYVLGSRAGRERYEQIRRAARRVADSPTLQGAAGLVGAQVTKAADVAKVKVRERVPFLSPRDDTGTGWPEEERKPEESGLPY